VSDENSDLVADSHNISNRWKKNFSQLLTVHKASDVRQLEIQTADPLVPDPSPFVVEIAVAKLKRSNNQVVIKFRKNLFKQEVKYYVL
jgi:hypothetical protein